MFRSSSLLTLLLLTAAGTASAQTYHVAGAAYPPGHNHNAAIEAVNNRITLGFGSYEISETTSYGTGSEDARALQLDGRYQGSFFAAGALAYIPSLGDDQNLGHILNFTLKAGLPLAAAPALQITPYGLYGRAKIDADGIAVTHEELGVGVLAQVQSGPLVFGLDVNTAQMINARLDVSLGEEYLGGPIHGSFPVDKNEVTSVRLEADWNVTGSHHLWASYAMFDWTLSADGYEDDVEESTLLIGYSFSF